MKKNIKIIILTLFLTICFENSKADYLNLENKIHSNWEAINSKIEISYKHFKKGIESIKWEYSTNSKIIITNPKGLQQAANTNMGGMRLWIYNEKAENSKIRFEFRNNKKVEYHFFFNINFTGWRACWIRFKEDMIGNKKSVDVNNLVIYSPNNIKHGSLFFDRMIFPKKHINRRATPDAQLPNINPKMKYNHWAALYHWETDYKHNITLNSKISASEVLDFYKIQKQIINSIKGKAPNKKKLTKINIKYNKLKIKRLNGIITGVPFIHKDVRIKKEGETIFKELSKIAIVFARDYYHNKNEDSKQKLYNLIDYMIDQGFDYNSGFGTNHHYGYGFRDIPQAILLMKSALARDGKLKKYAKIFNYWAGIQEHRITPKVGTLQGVVDTWNMMLQVRIICITIMPDSPEKVRELKAMTRWVNISAKIVPGSVGGIKADGCLFHHHGLYPAYSRDGLRGIGKYISYTNNTEFSLSKDARINIGKAIKTMDIYTNKTDWGFGICGRHPLSDNFNSAVATFAYLAQGGNPVTGEKIWTEMAEDYLRLEPKMDSIGRDFEKAGIYANETPSGNFTFNYAALEIHRRNNWMVTIKGYNNFVWGSEIYTKDNRYGRYNSYGTIQIIGKGNPVTAEKSGFKNNGWDWNHFPGATNIVLPLAQLDSPNKGTLMETSQDKFAGACNLDNENGIFGIILSERDRERFTPSFKARKSVFCFDNQIICLGSNICNSNSKSPTTTTLFQLSSDEGHKLILNNNSITDFPFKKNITSKKPILLTDNKDNAYYIKSGGNLIINNSHQISKHNKKKTKTEGNFVLAYLNHGKSPKNASYEYVILINNDYDDLEDFAEEMTEKDDAPYIVLQKNAKAHIVFHKESETTGFVIFEKGTINVKQIISSNMPCLVMIKNNEISVCNPDIGIKKTKLGVIPHKAKPSFVKLTFKGKVRIKIKNKYVKIINSTKTSTTIQFECIDGIPVQTELKFN